MDVVSTDQHTVKPWFAGKLSFSPPVTDLAGRGYPLVGGRLEYIDGHPAAALVYRFRKHIINALVWPSAGSPAPETSTSIGGYNEIQWSDPEMTWAVVSDMNASGLKQFAQVLQSAGKSPGTEPGSMSHAD
jgi:anti-sigma factor RsiW